MFNGSGQFTLVAGNPVITNQTISSAWANNTLNDIASGLSNTMTKDGQSTPTGNLKMGGFKLTGLAAGAGIGESVRWEQLFSQGLEQSIASASTVDIGGANTSFLNVTGTTTITSFGTNYNGPRFLRFADVVTLTNSSTLICLGGANITTAAGDVAIVVPKATSGTADGWYIAAYSSAAGIATANIANKAVTYAKIQDVTAGKVLGRDTSGNGVVQELPIAVTSSGNVGFGTSSPYNPGGYGRVLDVRGTGSSQILVGATESNASSVALQFDSASSNCLLSNNKGGGSLVFRTSASDDDRTERARIDSSGNFKFNSGYGSVQNAYGCRAWVNFNGTNGAIRGSGGVTSVTRNSIGNYTINLSFTMPDTNYSVGGACTYGGGSSLGVMIVPVTYTTTSFNFLVKDQGGNSRDGDLNNIQFFR